MSRLPFAVTRPAMQTAAHGKAHPSCTFSIPQAAGQPNRNFCYSVTLSHTGCWATATTFSTRSSPSCWDCPSSQDSGEHCLCPILGPACFQPGSQASGERPNPLMCNMEACSVFICTASAPARCLQAKTNGYGNLFVSNSQRWPSSHPFSHVIPWPAGSHPVGSRWWAPCTTTPGPTTSRGSRQSMSTRPLQRAT